MIFKASKRSGGRQLGAHLMKAEENEHVEIHEVSGFISDTVMGAMNEAYAAARGTKCQRYLFSMSLSPPAHESVRVETFEKAIADIEERLGLTGQPRVIVFHEKEGRRHCHAVWSRINAETMTAIDMPFFKNKLQALAKEVYLENGWKMPRGFENPQLRDHRNFSLDEWQQAKRIAHRNMEPLIAKREALKVQHQAERQAFDTKLETRWNEEQRIRSSRLRKGIAGAWDFLTGKYFKTRKQNEMEAKFARERDSHERHALIHAQHKDRHALQELIKENRRKEAERILGLYRDAAKFRQMREGEAERDRTGRTRDARSLSPKPRDRGLDLG